MDRERRKAYRDLNRGLRQMNRTTSIKFNGREVESELGRKLVVFGLILLFPLIFAFLLLMLPIMLALHPFFRVFGRVGTIRHEDNSLSIKLDGDSFRRG